MSYVYAEPPAPPPVPVRRGGLSMKWTDWTGHQWDLTDWRSGVFLTKEGTEGLYMPPHQAWVAESPAVHGQRYRGHSVDAREAFWPLYLYHDGTAEQWGELDTLFWKGLHPGKVGSWSVTAPTGTTRTLGLRFVEDGQHQVTHDPFKRGWARYGVTLVADDPFWYGQPHRRTWAQSETQNFYGGGSLLGPPFFIGSASQLSTATISNEGDVEAWPIWVGSGPFTSLNVGVAGSVVEAPIEALDGQTVIIDTDPTVQMAWLVTLTPEQQQTVQDESLGGLDILDRFGGTDVTEQLGTADFAPIPSGEDRVLSLSMVGTGSVMAEIRPRHYRAW